MRSSAVRSGRADAIAFARRLALMIFATIVLTSPGLGDDQKPDKTVTRGDVFCAWSIYLRIQIRTANCGFARQPIDDAIDEAITEIEEFGLAHFSTDYITRQKLEDARRILKESPLWDPARNNKLCKEGGFIFFDSLRRRDPDQFRKEVKEFLSRPLGPPRPVPCL